MPWTCMHRKAKRRFEHNMTEFSLEVADQYSTISDFLYNGFGCRIKFNCSNYGLSSYICGSFRSMYLSETGNVSNRKPVVYPC